MELQGSLHCEKRKEKEKKNIRHATQSWAQNNFSNNDTWAYTAPRTIETEK
jgi:hypothetical protein